MGHNQIRGDTQIMDGTISSAKVDSNFMSDLYVVEPYTGDGHTTVYTLTATPIVASITVVRRGLCLAALRVPTLYNDEYTYNPVANTITMATAVDSGDSLEIKYFKQI